MRTLAALGLDSTAHPSRQDTYQDQYPANALLNAAIAASPTEAVVVAGQGAMPSLGLGQQVLASLSAGAGEDGRASGGAAGPGIREAKERLEMVMKEGAEENASGDFAGAQGVRCGAVLVPVLHSEGSCVPRSKASAIGLVRKQIQAALGGDVR